MGGAQSWDGPTRRTVVVGTLVGTPGGCDLGEGPAGLTNRSLVTNPRARSGRRRQCDRWCWECRSPAPSQITMAATASTAGPAALA